MSGDTHFRLGALDATRSILVRAPAGSGKTELLTARYLALLSEGGLRGGACLPNQILAVTYTEKAALEMKARIALWLDRARSGFEPRSDWERTVLSKAEAAWGAHDRNESLLMNPTAYRIQTFHGFCSSLCRAWPIESGVPVNAEVLPDQRQVRVREEAVAALLRNLRRRHETSPLADAYERRLAALQNRSRTLAGRLATLLHERLRLGSLAQASGPGAEAAQEALDRLLKALAEPLYHLFSIRPEAWKVIRDAYQAKPLVEGILLPDDLPVEGVGGVADWHDISAALLTTDKSLRKPSGAVWKEARTVLETMPQEGVEALAFFRGLELEPGSREEEPRALRDYLALAEAAQAYLEPLIPGEGLDFVQLEVGAGRALRNANAQGLPSRSLIFCHDNLRHILVDESQDMNRFQLDLLGLLTDSWEGESADNPHTVFVVGDPKQSIYRFRGAEVALFDELAHEGLHRPGQEPFSFGEPVALAANFRSAPALVAFANDLFRRVFGTPPPMNASDEVPFGDGEATVERPAFSPVLRLATFTNSKEQEISSSVREAQWVAREVSRLYASIRQDPARGGETVGILLPRRTQLESFVAALRIEEVPVRMVEGEKLLAKPEVFHLHNLFRALARPYDDVAWAGLLRAPWCRVSEAVLFELAQSEEGRGNWVERMRESDHPEILRVVEALSPARADFGREAYDATLQRAWENMGGPEATASRYGTPGVGNAFAYLDLLSQCGGMPAEEALQFVEEGFEKSFTPPDPAAATSPVHLMTIHKAKGLEFDHLFAVYLGYPPRGGNNRDRPPYLLLDLPDSTGKRVPCAAAEPDGRWRGKGLSYTLLSEVTRRRELAEIKRLFYVAVTRAKRSITLSGSLRVSKGAPEGRAQEGSPMSLLMEAIYEETALRPEFHALERLVDPVPEVSVIKQKERGENGATPVPPLRSFPLPYLTQSPSEKLDAEEDQAKAGGEDEYSSGGAEDDDNAATFGKILHRLLEKLAREGAQANLPRADAVAAALKSEGVDISKAKAAAPQLLQEARAAWDDPAFAALREGGELLPEWGIEHFLPKSSPKSAKSGEGQDTVMTGRLDLVIVKEGEVVIVDYKTSRRPAEKSLAQFREEIRGHYGPQLQRYEAMLATIPRFTGKAVHSHLLLTHLPEDRLL